MAPSCCRLWWTSAIVRRCLAKFQNLQVVQNHILERLRNHTCTAAYTCTFSEVLNPISVILKYIDLEITRWFTLPVFFFKLSTGNFEGSIYTSILRCSISGYVHVIAQFGVDGHVIHIRIPNIPGIAVRIAIIQLTQSLTCFSIALHVQRTRTRMKSQPL